MQLCDVLAAGPEAHTLQLLAVGTGQAGRRDESSHDVELQPRTATMHKQASIEQASMTDKHEQTSMNMQATMYKQA